VFLGRRDEVVLRLLLDTGVRVSELCGLELTDVDLDRELAYVTGKGSRPRVVPFGARSPCRSRLSRSRGWRKRVTRWSCPGPARPRGQPVPGRRDLHVAGR
jgi:integrase